MGAPVTFIEQLRDHVGGLIRLKTEIYWTGSGYDARPGRTCLLLDVATLAAQLHVASTDGAITAARNNSVAGSLSGVALLLIEGSPHWVWLVKEDMELL